jgi:hypothetical protein
MAKITIGEYEFKSKKEAQELYRNILNSSELDTPLMGEDFTHAMSLFLNHPKADEKIGGGIQSIVVSQAKFSTNRCFHIIREDNTKEDFSIGKCINGEHSSFHKFCIAARNAIDEDMLNYKIDYFNKNQDEDKKVKCQITNKKVSKDEIHLDHREPFTFSSIAHFFIKAKGINLDEIQYITKEKYGNEFQDLELINSFKEWHKDNAKLRIVSKYNNLAKGYLGRIASTKADGTL